MSLGRHVFTANTTGSFVLLAFGTEHVSGLSIMNLVLKGSEAMNDQGGKRTVMSETAAFQPTEPLPRFATGIANLVGSAGLEPATSCL